MNKFWFAAFLLIVNTNCFAQLDSAQLGIRYGLIKTTPFINHQAVKRKEFRNSMKNNITAYREYKTGRTLEISSTILMIPSSILLFATWQSQYEGNRPYPWQWPASISGTGISLLLYYLGKKKVIHAVDIYNAKNNRHVSLRQQGLGFSINF